MIDQLEQLVQGLGEIFQIPLHVDRNHACAIQIKKGLIIQLQTDIAQELLVITSQIIELPPGKFRENVLQAAMRSNGKKDPLIGIFSYVPKSNQLFLFQKYPFDILTSERLANLLVPFMDMAEHWRDAIGAGRAGPIDLPPPSSSTAGPFGLKP